MAEHAAPDTVYLKDYRPSDYLIDQTHLTFALSPTKTTVTSHLHIRRNPDLGNDLPDLKLDGEHLHLERIRLNGQTLSDPQYQVSQYGLSVTVHEAAFELEIVTHIDPEHNHTLAGLYLSKNMYCTQCEAEGFRNITYYLDRPDVMAVFSTTIIASSEYPVLLSNGNLTDQGQYEDGRHWATWHDPFPKPAYLFALVAGDLGVVEDHYVTSSGRQVTLKVFTEHRNLNKCDHVLPFLKKAMRWDEKFYGREYDLDIFMIVAVDHFNMGAMENKGLNIFNSSCVLASPDTATDSTYERIEGIVAHEYFHNWSGNRVTCRDWFQLSLKEGFTVFRDAEFTADTQSRIVKRIMDVNMLRSAQFAEDAGPMAHPIRPDRYMEISNFYTLTVYEKGAEVVRMIHTLLGAEGFRKGSDLYFERHDGQAVTCEDFVAAMEAANQVDLQQFKRWYNQAGTPKVTVTDRFDEQQGTYYLTLAQNCPPSPNQPEKAPFHIPFTVGLLAGDGQAIALDEHPQGTRLLNLTEPVQVFEFTGLSAKPLPSLLRGFSAPVHVDYPYTLEQLAFLMRYDNDEFNRWDASQRLATQVILDYVEALLQQQTPIIPEPLFDAVHQVLLDNSLDHALKAALLQLPSCAYLAEQMDVIHPDALDQARQKVRQALASRFEHLFTEHYQALNTVTDYAYEQQQVSTRMLKNLCLDYLAALETQEHNQRLIAQYESANNMTDRAAALRLLVETAPLAQLQPILNQFYETWKADSQVVDMWFSLQATSVRHARVDSMRALTEHPAFDSTSPNHIRAVIGGFCAGNPVQFHADNGAGYELLADWVIRLDQQNPQTASRLLQPLTRWSRYDVAHQALMIAQLERIAAQQPLSSDIHEVVSKSLPSI